MQQLLKLFFALHVHQVPLLRGNVKKSLCGLALQGTWKFVLKVHHSDSQIPLYLNVISFTPVTKYNFVITQTYRTSLAAGFAEKVEVA